MALRMPVMTESKTPSDPQTEMAPLLLRHDEVGDDGALLHEEGVDIARSNLLLH